MATILTVGFAKLSKAGKIAKVFDRLDELVVQEKLPPALNKIVAGSLEKGRDAALKFRVSAKLARDDWCFTAGTLVSTASSKKPIGQIEPGEKVYAFDFSRQQ